MKIFDDNWMKNFREQWNKEPALAEALANIQFSSTIGYGFPDNKNPAGYIEVVNGHCTEAGAYDGRELNLDIRAEEKNWFNWFSIEFGITSLGLAFTTGKLKLLKGDFNSLISNPGLAGPFVRSFGAMARV